MRLKFDFSFMDSRVVSSGVDLSRINTKKTAAAHDFVTKNGCKGDMSWMNLPSEQELAQIIDYASNVKNTAQSLVVCGIGGSALGSLCCARALLSLNHNELPRRKRNAPKLYVEDNIDAERLHALLSVVDLKNTYFNFVTKSGATTETITQFLIIYNILSQKLGKTAQSRIAITTTAGNSALYSFAVNHKIRVFGIPMGVGGRFSVFSAVGLVPLACLGLDIKALLRGAAYMAKSCLSSDIKQNPALIAAYLMHSQLKAGKTISVMMPYAESLKYTADFYAQLWGESLSKAYDNSGNLINSGQTPLKVLGTTDQHSQLQLFCDGPNDKVVTFIRVESFRKRIKIPPMPDGALSGFNYMAKSDVSDVLNACQQAAAYTLATQGRTSFCISLPYVCEYTIGQLLNYFMYKTAYMGALMGINAYNQPAVEQIKSASRALIDTTDTYLRQQINSINSNPYIIYT